jgi:hypothetical protein
MTMRYQVAPGSLRVAGRILFGVDGWDGSHRALSWAIAEARVRGSLVQAVTVWRSPYDSDEMEDLWVELGPDRAERIETVENERLAARARAHSEATLAAVAGPDPSPRSNQPSCAGTLHRRCASCRGALTCSSSGPGGTEDSPGSCSGRRVPSVPTAVAARSSSSQCLPPRTTIHDRAWPDKVWPGGLRDIEGQ